MPYTTQGYMTGADMADLADLYDWNAEPCDSFTQDLDEPDGVCSLCGQDHGPTEVRNDQPEGEPWTPGEYDPTGPLRSRAE